jgi:predicted DNA-binding transcriptional regulator YafY
VHAPGSAIRESIGRWANVEDVEAATCRLRMSVDSLDWPALALGSIGAEFEVLGPPELIEHVREWSARFGRATGYRS